MSDKLKLQKLHTRAEFDLNSVDKEKRTVDVIWTTGARGKRFDWRTETYFYEELGLEAENIRAEFLNSGRAPVLNEHGRWDEGVEGAVGKVVAGSVQREGAGWRATLQYDTDEASERVWGKIERGFAPNVSVGYKIHAMQRMDDVEEGGKSYRVLRATDWEPMEISNVKIPFDRGAHTRSENEELYDVAVVTRSDEVIDDNQETRVEPETTNKQEKNTMPETTPNPAGTPAVDTEKVRTEAIAAERKRTADILDAVRKAGLDDSFAHELLQSEKTVDEARAAIIDKFAAQDPHNGQRGVTVKADETDKFRQVMADALVMRSNPGMKLADSDTENREREGAARQYRSFRLLDMAREVMERNGESVRGLSPDEIAKRAITSTTSDFPVIMENTINRVLLANYTAAADTWRRFCAVGSVSDFRDHERLRLGSLSRLDKVLETGEFKNKKISDADKEVIRAFEYGNIINLSRTAIINDSLDAFGRLPGMLGRAAARSIEVDVYAMFAENAGNGPTMNDGQPLFHSTHNNINNTASALTVDGIDADRVVMATQKEKDNNDFLDLRPSILVLPIGLGGTARVINDAQYDPDTANKLQRPNKVRGLFRDIVDTPRLSGTTRYLFADPSIEPVFEVAFLNGNQTPYLESMESFRQSGIEWKIRLDYGVGAIGYRGVVRNAGTSG
jgi:hypothetical protein